MKQSIIIRSRVCVIAVVVALALFPLVGCTGSDGDNGKAGTSHGTLKGNVTNNITSSPVSDVSVKTDPEIEGVSISTGGSGGYAASLPAGIYSVTYSKSGFSSQTTEVSVLAGVTTTIDIKLVPTSPVAVNAGSNKSAGPDESVNLGVTYDILDDSTFISIQWSLAGTVSGVTILNGTTATPTVVLPPVGNFMDELFEVIATPPIEESDLPPNVELPDGEFPAGLRNRTEVQPVNPFDLEEASLVPLKVTITTTSGTYTDTVDITVSLPWHSSTGLPAQPRNAAILLHGKDMGDSSWTWSLTNPSGGNANGLLNSTNAQNTWFTPTQIGTYSAVVTNSGALSNTLDIWTGDYVGVIDNGLTIEALDIDKRPVVDQFCASTNACHADEGADWRQSGHAEIFTNNFNTGGHYSTGCLECHTVGFNTEAANSGFDDQPSYSNFLDEFTSDGTTFEANINNWKNMLINFPQLARRANAQCENCHGPQTTAITASESAHGDNFEGVTFERPRQNISSNVCATCHGEPLRHARYQQWQLSRHANYDGALGRATVEARGDGAAHCGRCHSGQGFLAWITQGDLTLDIQGSGGDATEQELAELGLTEDTVHPITCATCHLTHNPGSMSGEPTNATVRIVNSTALLPAGFKAVEVGRGAICITCHNTRNGARNDALYSWPTLLPNDRAPHSAAQGDVLMGQNAFFVTVGDRGAHSYLTNACVNCHMEQTPPPALLSYNLGGTNHTFAPSPTICTNCHGIFDGGSLQESIKALLVDLEEKVEDTIAALIEALADTHTFEMRSNGDSFFTVAPADFVNSVTLTEHHGRMSFDATVWDDSAGMYVSFTNVEMDGDTRVDGGLSMIDFSEGGQTVAKATWNYLLLEVDNSFGVHNPVFVQRVINESSFRLDTVSLP